MAPTLSIPPLTKDLSRILIDADTISRRVDELAHKIDEKYKNLDEPLILVGVLKGSFIFMADLSRKLSIEHVVDFIAISSYGEKGDKRGEVRLLMDTRENLADHHVLIVEDIIDSGYTLKYLKEYFADKQAADVKVVTLLDKPMARKVNIQPDFTAFTLEKPAFIVSRFVNYILNFYFTPI